MISEFSRRFQWSIQETDNVGVVVFGDDRAIVEGAGLSNHKIHWDLTV